MCVRVSASPFACICLCVHLSLRPSVRSVSLTIGACFQSRKGGGRREAILFGRQGCRHGSVPSLERWRGTRCGRSRCRVQSCRSRHWLAPESLLCLSPRQSIRLVFKDQTCLRVCEDRAAESLELEEFTALKHILFIVRPRRYVCSCVLECDVPMQIWKESGS